MGDPQLRLSFGNVAETYHRVRPPYSQEVLDRAQAALALGADARVLDLAAGTGRLTSELAQRFAHVVAVEPSDAMRALIRDGDVRAGSAEAIPLEDASVDAVFVGEAFHWFDPRAAIAEIARVLRPRGGLAVVHTHWWETEPPLPDAALELLRGPWERFAAQRNAPWDGAFDASPFEPLRYERFEEAIDVSPDELLELYSTTSSLAAHLVRRAGRALRAGATAARRRLPAADQARAGLDAARAMKRAVVVGAGPNGLAGAVELAKAGFDVTVHEAAATVGGGCRTAELTLPGFRHDVCAAVLPLARRSPAFAGLELDWIDPPVPAAHALDGDAVTLERALQHTADGLGADAQSYRALVEPFVRAWPKRWSRRDVLRLRPSLVRGLLSARAIARLFTTERARALFAGNAAHSAVPLERAGSAGFGFVLCAAAHVDGWAFLRGGSQTLVDALAERLSSLGGEIVTSSTVDELPRADVVLCDLAPREFSRIARLADYASSFRQAPAAFKVDWALDGPIPWSSEACRRAGTVHVGGRFAEIAESERAPWEDRSPARPFVILTQPSLFDDVARAGGQAHGVGVLPRAACVGRRCDGRNRVAGRAVRARIPRARPRPPRDDAARLRGVQPERRRRRRPRRREHVAAARRASEVATRAVANSAPRCLPVLVVDPSRRRRARSLRAGGCAPCAARSVAGRRRRAGVGLVGRRRRRRSRRHSLR